MEKYGFVYLWYDRKHKRYYIGCRWGREDDGYVCSSFWMKRAQKLRPQDFKRRILTRVYTNRKDLLDEEHKWLSKVSDDELGKRYYNLTNHRNGHWTENKHTPTIEKLKLSWTEEKRQKAREQKLRWIEDNSELHVVMSKKAGKANKGRKHTEEWKKEQATRLKNQWSSGQRKPHINIKGPRRPRKNVICPHCQKNGDVSIMKRWHFGNCKKAEGKINGFGD